MVTIKCHFVLQKEYVIIFCIIVTLQLELHQDNVTRVHSQKLVNSRCHYDLRKYSILVRILNVWNSLSASMISANNVNTFNNRLCQPNIVFDYRSTLTGTCNNSFVDNLFVDSF